MTVRSRTVGVVVMVLSLAALAVSGYSGLRYREYARCQAAVNDLLVERTRILAEIGADERAAERRRDDALDAVFGDPSLLKPREAQTSQERARVLALFREYLAAQLALRAERVRADTARAENPLPAAPSQTCGP